MTHRFRPLFLFFFLLCLAPAGAHADWQQKVDAAVLQAVANGETELLVLLSEQADLSEAALLQTKEGKTNFVFQRKTAVARATQPAVTAVLDALGAPYRSFWIVNALHVRGGLAVVQALAARGDVAHIYESSLGGLDLPGGSASAAFSTAVTGSPEPNLVKVRADQVWALGYTGQGVVVAGADSGVEWTHPALRDHYRGWNGTTADHDYNWHDAIRNPNTECPGSSPEPCDDDALLGGGHGSHTMGTMVGDDGLGNQTGMAPGARWIACRNMHYGVGAVPTYLDCMQWFLAPTNLAGQNPDPSQSPHVINNSWGCAEACPPTILRETTAAIRAAGIFYAASAGNEGSRCSTTAFPPGIYPESFTVGATNIATDEIASFSSRGPVLVLDPLNPHRKPDVTAPGVDVRSALKGGVYGELNGTSMASPHVAGLVALLISANPALAGQVDRLESIIERTAVPLTSTQGCGGDGPNQVPNNVYGWGRIDALAAVEAALASCAAFEDSHRAVEYKGGWGVVESPVASGGVYHRRVGSKNGNGATPAARLVFTGNGVTYRFARSTAGGTAEIYIDGVLRETLSYASADAAPTFGHSVRYTGLGEGTHELRIVHKSGTVYVDNFQVCGAADAAAATAHSETTTSTAGALEGPVVSRAVTVGPGDEEVGLVVEGSAVPLTVRLLDGAGTLLTSGNALGLSASGLDAVPSATGTYRFEVLNPSLVPLRISITRTVRNR
jgi:serine protease AprX